MKIEQREGYILAKNTGGVVKRTSEKKFEMHAIRWHDPNRKDLDGEWFSQKTFLMKSAGYPIINAPVNYQHGMTKGFGSLGIGILTFADEDEIGEFVAGELKTREEYIAMLHELGRATDQKMTDKEVIARADLAVKAVDALIAETELQGSGGFDPATWVVDPETKHIDQAGMIHLAFTPTPADDMNPVVRFKSAWERVISPPPSTTTYSIPDGNSNSIQPPEAHKEATEEPKDVTGDEEGGDPIREQSKATPITENDMTVKTKMVTVEEVIEALRPHIEEMIGNPADATAMADEIEEELKMEEEDEELKTEDEEELAGKAFALAVKKIEAWQKSQKRVADKFKAERDKWAKAQLPTDEVPGFKGSPDGNKGHVTVGDNMKYAHLSALDMAMAFKIATSADKRPRGLEGRKATEFVSEDFYRVAVNKMAEHAQRTTFKRAEDALFVKSALPFKAGELNASDITGQGLEYLGNVYDAVVWESARNNRIYQMMQSRGMMEKPVPQGAKSAIVAVEGDDPTVYGGIEGNSVDATGRPEVVYKISPLTTSNVTVTPGTFRTATAYTFELGEDSFVDMAQEANRKVRLALEENIEKAMIHGDTETAATTNISDIGGTPTATGLTRDYFLEFDGLRKSPLITSTAYRRDGGALTISDYRATWALLGSAQASHTENIFFLIDFDTLQATLDLSQLLTKDVADNENTLFTGELEKMWGIPIYQSGFFGKSNGVGKIDRTTPGNNTKGQIMAVYAPYWAFVYKRNISIEMQRSPESESFEFYGSMRFSLQRRSAAAAAISYNLTV